MRKLKNQFTVPGDGFIYTQEETMKKFKTPSFDEMMVQVKAHRKANNIPIGANFEAEIEDAVCRNMPDTFWFYTDPSNKPDKIYASLGINELVEGTKNLIAWATGGFKRVSPEVAEERAAICANCEDMRAIQGCVSCGLREIVVQITAKQQTTFNDRLGACMNCQCACKALVWLPQELMENSVSEEQLKQYPNYCWKIKGRK